MNSLKDYRSQAERDSGVLMQRIVIRMSFYCIVKTRELAWKPWHNWIVNVQDMKRCGIRVGWLWLDVEINHYDRNKHLQSILNGR